MLSIQDPIPSIGKTGTVSGTAPDAADKWNVKNAFDNNAKTSWKSPIADTTATISIDLGEPKSIGAAAFSEAGGRTQKYLLEYKDGNQWKTILEGKGIGNNLKTFTPVVAREFRLNIVSAKSGGVEIKEFQLYYQE